MRMQRSSLGGCLGSIIMRYGEQRKAIKYKRIRMKREGKKKANTRLSQAKDDGISWDV